MSSCSSCSGPAQTSIVERVEHRLAGISGLPLQQLERLVVVRYAPGEKFGEHHDGKFRPKTVFIYLNDLPEGDAGDTFFPHLGLSFVPRAGCAVMWSNAMPDGKEDSRMIHAGQPPLTGVKYGINAFFHEERMRMVDYPAEEWSLDEAFTVDIRSLSAEQSKSEQVGNHKVHTFTLATVPPVIAVPRFASEDEVSQLLEIANIAGASGTVDAVAAAVAAASSTATAGEVEEGLLHREGKVLHIFGHAETSILASLEKRASIVAQFPHEHLGAVRVTRSATWRGLCDRGCGQKSAIVCLSEQGEVLFPHLGVHCILRRGDLLLWPNAIRSAFTGDVEGQVDEPEESQGAQEQTADRGRRRVVEDLRTLREHVNIIDGPMTSLDFSFHDAPMRETDEAEAN